MVFCKGRCWHDFPFLYAWFFNAVVTDQWRCSAGFSHPCICMCRFTLTRSISLKKLYMYMVEIGQYLWPKSNSPNALVHASIFFPCVLDIFTHSPSFPWREFFGLFSLCSWNPVCTTQGNCLLVQSVCWSGSRQAFKDQIIACYVLSRKSDPVNPCITYLLSSTWGR